MPHDMQVLSSPTGDQIPTLYHCREHAILTSGLSEKSELKYFRIFKGIKENEVYINVN